MKKIILFICLYMCILSTQAQQIAFSDSAIVSLITCSPGEEVYAKFGHTAIRINDPKSKLDVVFNYGMFSFDTPNFYLKFINGETDYQLGVYDTNNFLPEYKQRNSIVWEQILNINVQEKRTLIQRLLTNYEAQNRVYRYNFVFDNCATRPRDIILGSMRGYTSFQPTNDSRTFRQWIGIYVGTDTWLKFGIDLIFGIDADKSASQSETTFLPEILMNELQTAQIITRDKQNIKLVKDKKILVNKTEFKIDKPNSFWSFNPLTVSIFFLIVGMLVTLWDTGRKRNLKIFDSVMQITTGLTGFILLYMMIFSSHPLVKSNLNLLWLNPLNLITGILIWIKSAELRQYLFFYQIFNILLLVAALFIFALSVQAFNIATFPLIVLLIIRSTLWFAYTKHKLYRRREMK